MKYIFSLLIVLMLLSCGISDKPIIVDSKKDLFLKIDKSKFREHNPITLDSLRRKTSHEIFH